MQDFRGTFVNKNRDAWVEINLSHLENNVLKIKEYLKNAGFCPDLFAVIKADCYGHGSIMCAPVFCALGVKEFGAASIDEGIELRENKITEPVLVLGASPLWAFENAIKYNITLSVFNNHHLETAKQLYKRLNKKLQAAIKIDTGMNRIGVNCKNAHNFIQKTLECDYIETKSIFTHFADVENKDLFKRQIDDFNSLVDKYRQIFKERNIKIHCLNSSGIFSYPQYSYDMVRMGVIMWGLTPYSDTSEENKKLKDFLPVMGLKARITNLHALKKGDGISYGHTFIAQNDMKIATIPLGYADGVARKLSGNISAVLNNKPIKQVGRITMDQMMFDVTGIDCEAGDIITLIGKENKLDTIDSWAKKLDTINYEITCRLKMRLPRIYVR